MAFALNYTLKMVGANGNIIKGDVINHMSLKGDNGAGIDLAAQLEQNQAYRLHIPMVACGALGQTIKVEADVADGANVTNAMAVEAVVYENVLESLQALYFDRKYGFNRNLPVIRNAEAEANMSVHQSLFSGVGAVTTLSGDARFSCNLDGTTDRLVITPNGMDVIILRARSRFGALGDTA